jgi:SAM-dependent methyltransferase
LYGLDLDIQLIHEAQTQTARSHFVQATAIEIPFSDTTFDLVIALHLVEHLPQPERFFAEARRVLRGKGLLMIATPNPKGIGARLMGERWAEWQDESHINLNPPAYWRELIRGNGFIILKDGTTGLSGIPVFQKLPMALINRVPLFLFGFFPWMHGEAYVCVAGLQR